MDDETKIRQKDNEILGDESVNDESPAHALGSFIWELIKVLVLALVIIVPLRVFIAEPFIVSGSSMVPNFHNREYLIIDKITYRFTEPNRGDVIVFKYPKNPSQYFIKRIIGLPGEKLEVKDGHVIVYNKEHPDGEVLPEEYLSDENSTFNPFGRDEVISLGSDEFYVLGDNRQASSDSRSWGVLPRKNFVGRAWFRVFPLDNLGFLTSGHSYSF
jgi:signal peptidase I